MAQPPDEFRALPMPGRLKIPCPTEPKPPGTRVAAGESLCVDGRSTPSPASGEIIGIETAVPLGGRTIPAVVLRTDARTDEPEEDPPVSFEQIRAALTALTPDRLQASIADFAAAGIEADRWTCPNLTDQLTRAADKPVTTVLCGALDLDPVLPLQRLLIAAHPIELAAGVMGLVGLTGARRGVIALPEDLPAPVVRAIKAAALATSARLDPLPNEYPLAHPSVLIRRVLGRRLKPGRSPIEARVIFLDAPAAIAIGRRLLHRRPMLRVPFGIYDRTRAKADFSRVPVGTGAFDALQAAEIDPAFGHLRTGHVLRDIAVEADQIIGPGELTAYVIEPAHRPTATACLRCGWCVEACPVRVHPAGLLEAAQQQDLAMADRYGLQSCIDCGICTYVCPARLPLLSAIRELRTA